MYCICLFSDLRAMTYSEDSYWKSSGEGVCFSFKKTCRDALKLRIWKCNIISCILSILYKDEINCFINETYSNSVSSLFQIYWNPRVPYSAKYACKKIYLKLKNDRERQRKSERERERERLCACSLSLINKSSLSAIFQSYDVILNIQQTFLKGILNSIYLLKYNIFFIHVPNIAIHVHASAHTHTRARTNTKHALTHIHAHTCTHTRTIFIFQTQTLSLSLSLS